MTQVNATLAILPVVYLAATTTMYSLQRQFQYVPSRTNPGPAAVGLTGVQVEHLATPHGKMVVLSFCHGGLVCRRKRPTALRAGVTGPNYHEHSRKARR